MRALLVSEGKHEEGALSASVAGHEREGALMNLIAHLSNNGIHCEFERVSNPRVHRHPGKGPRYFRRALGWLREAERRHFNALIFVIDRDGEKKRVKEIGDAQASRDSSSLPRAMGVAIEKFDAWMLADETALSKVLNYTVSRQPDPESMANPKEVCRRLLDESDEELDQTTMYARVAEEARIELIEERCPRGFKPFADRVRGLVNTN